MIETTYKWNGEKPIIIITHSMGGLMALHFLQNQTQVELLKWKYVSEKHYQNYKINEVEHCQTIFCLWEGYF